MATKTQTRPYVRWTGADITRLEKLIAKGFTNAQIAEKMGRSLATISSYAARLRAGTF